MTYRGALLGLLMLAGCSGQAPSTVSGQCITMLAPTEPPSGDIILISDGFGRSAGGIYSASWPNTPIPINVDTPEIRQAANYWLPAGVRFAFGRPSGIQYLGDKPDTPYCGVAYVYAKSGTIRAANIYTNSTLINAGRCGSKVEVLAHELGHAIGVIGHTQDGGLMDPTGGNHLITVSVRNAIYQLYNECGQATPVNPEGNTNVKDQDDQPTSKGR